jgi:hypothetical protein
MKTRKHCFFTLVLFLSMLCGASHAFAAEEPQYLGFFVGTMPYEPYFKEGLPDTYNEDGFKEVLDAIGTRGTSKRRPALFFTFNYFRQSIDLGVGGEAFPSLRRLLNQSFGFTEGGEWTTTAMKQTLENVLAASLKTEMPVIIRLDGNEWWELRPDLWNWWNENEAGYNPDNINNVERFDWGTSTDTAVKIGWRNWGSQMRIPPAPNTASRKYREEQEKCLDLLLPVIADWYKDLPSDKKHLFGGMMFGWELSVYGNNYYYVNGNDFLPQDPGDDPDRQKDSENSEIEYNPDDPKYDQKRLGYAAAQILGLQDGKETLTQESLDEISVDYLDFLIGLAVKHGIPENLITTHVLLPWPFSGNDQRGRAAVSKKFKGVTPGWSWHGPSRGLRSLAITGGWVIDYTLSGLDRFIDYADGGPWSLSETGSGISYSGSDINGVYKTAAEVQEGLEKVLAYRNNRKIIFVNWGGNYPGKLNHGVKYQPILLEGIRRVLLGGQAKLGMYHFPGWEDSPVYPRRWPSIKDYDPGKPGSPYLEREPLQGWYDDSKTNIVNQQLEQMVDNGIGFVAFAWYRIGGASWEDRTDATISAYHDAPMNKRIDYALLWANHYPYPRTLPQWEGIVDDMIEHFKKPEYLRIDGRPVVIIFSNNDAPKYVYDPPNPPDPDSGDPGLAWQANEIRKSLGGPTFTAGTMLNHARDRAEAAGVGRIYFVQATEALSYWVQHFARESEIDALTGYNYHHGTSFYSNPGPSSRSFIEMDGSYRQQWDDILNNAPAGIPYFVPMTSGWDARPWGSSGSHQKSVSTPQSFEAHLRAGYDRITRDTDKTKGIGMLCCWNEYGEGSYIEPTKRYGFEYLERVRKVFGGK